LQKLMVSISFSEIVEQAVQRTFCEVEICMPFWCRRQLSNARGA
jgi:hypothetical protein